MTIASNVAAQGVNWDGGTVGTNELNRGHSDSSPNEACAADADDNNAYVEGSCAGASSGTFNQRRTHTLSNGEIIWDLNGNAPETVNYFNDYDKPSPGSSWREFTAMAGNTTIDKTDFIPQIAIDNAWDSSKNIGRYYPGTNDNTNGVFIRGGGSNWGAVSGLFQASLSSSSASSAGFRYVVDVP